MEVKFTNYFKFDSNINIKIIDFVEIDKFYKKFEKSTLFTNKILNHTFDKKKLIDYINMKFNNYKFSNNIFIYNLNIEFLDFSFYKFII